MNWINNQNGHKLTTIEKVRQLLKMSYKLIFVQVGELENLKRKNNFKDVETNYINRIYNHFVVNELTKTDYYLLKI